MSKPSHSNRDTPLHSAAAASPDQIAEASKDGPHVETPREVGVGQGGAQDQRPASAPDNPRFRILNDATWQDPLARVPRQMSSTTYLTGGAPLKRLPELPQASLARPCVTSANVPTRKRERSFPTGSGNGGQAASELTDWAKRLRAQVAAAELRSEEALRQKTTQGGAQRQEAEEGGELRQQEAQGDLELRAALLPASSCFSLFRCVPSPSVSRHSALSLHPASPATSEWLARSWGTCTLASPPAPLVGSPAEKGLTAQVTSGPGRAERIAWLKEHLLSRRGDGARRLQQDARPARAEAVSVLRQGVTCSSVRGRPGGGGREFDMDSGAALCDRMQGLPQEAAHCDYEPPWMVGAKRQRHTLQS